MTLPLLKGLIGKIWRGISKHPVSCSLVGVLCHGQQTLQANRITGTAPDGLRLTVDADLAQYYTLILPGGKFFFVLPCVAYS